MAPHHKRQVTFAIVPEWMEREALSRALLNDVPALVLLRVPGEQSWQIATRGESDAIADPGSYIGSILRSHSGLLGLNNISAN